MFRQHFHIQHKEISDLIESFHNLMSIIIILGAMAYWTTITMLFKNLKKKTFVPSVPVEIQMSIRFRLYFVHLHKIVPELQM